MLCCGAVWYAVQSDYNFRVWDEILKCDHSKESYWAVLPRGAVYYAVHYGSNVWVVKIWDSETIKDCIFPLQGEAREGAERIPPATTEQTWSPSQTANTVHQRRHGLV